MVAVNPPLLNKIPQKLLDDPELGPYFLAREEWEFKMWTRTGGGDDAISSVENGELYEPGIQTFDEDEAEDFPELNVVETNEPIEVVTINSDYTTTGSQIIICTNTNKITITTNLTPGDTEQLHIKRQNRGGVDVVGPIDGDTIKTIARRYDAPHIVFTVAANEWSII